MAQPTLPMTFDSCPNCSSTRRFCAEMLGGKVPGDRVPAIYQGGILYQAPGQLLPEALQAFVDVCLDCGILYAFRLEKIPVTPHLSRQ